MVQVMSREQHDERERIVQAFFMRHCIYFSPRPQARHRIVYSNRSRIHLYDPSYRDKIYFKEEVKQHLRESLGIFERDYPLTKSSVSVDVTFMISRPASHFVGNDRNRGIRPEFECIFPTTQGDVDNFLKFFLDAINGIFYNDDRDVVSITTSKLFTTNPIGRYVFNVRRRVIEIVDLTNNDNENNDAIVDLTDNDDENNDAIIDLTDSDDENSSAI